MLRTKRAEKYNCHIVVLLCLINTVIMPKKKNTQYGVISKHFIK